MPAVPIRMPFYVARAQFTEIGGSLEDERF